MSRFQKLDATGQLLAAPATDHAAVLDTTSGLMWHAGEHDEQTFAEAQATIDKLNADAFLGFTDWRLPTLQELFGLADHSRCEPAIDTDAFPNCESDWYWTSTQTAWSSDLVWIVLFDGGYVDYYRRYGYAFVRAVRRVSPAGQ